MTFDLQIDIGTDQQRSDIRSEFFSLVECCIGQISLPERTVRVHIPADFESAVRQFTGSDDYRAIQSKNLSLAKVVFGDSSDSLVLSPALFTDLQDSQTRAFFYFHEFSHLVDGPNTSVPDSPNASTMLTEDTKFLFAEYRANRTALKLKGRCFAHCSERYLSLIRHVVSQFCKNLTSESDHEQRLRHLTNEFKFRRINFEQFCADALPVVRSLLLSVFHLLGYLHFPEAGLKQVIASAIDILPTVSLIGPHLRDLSQTLSDAYESGHNSVQLREVLKRIYGSLGINLSDTPNGVYMQIDFINTKSAT